MVTDAQFRGPISGSNKRLTAVAELDIVATFISGLEFAV
jgi:hypothetical protein